MITLGQRDEPSIELSVIYGKQKDFKASLDVLNKYLFLFDSNITGRNNIAVSYNNRCFAYMELGDLKKALDDCTASLKYGSLPDAYHKQQELIKRLKPRGSDL